jgi:hypothetical protein
MLSAHFRAFYYANNGLIMKFMQSTSKNTINLYQPISTSKEPLKINFKWRLSSIKTLFHARIEYEYEAAAVLTVIVLPRGINTLVIMFFF